MNRVIWTVGHALVMRGQLEPAGEIRRLATRWDEYGFTAKARCMGLIDSLHLEVPVRDVLTGAVMSQPDGFDRLWQNLFGDPGAPDRWLAECREDWNLSHGETVPSACRECGIPMQVPVGLPAEAHLCRRHLLTRTAQELTRLAWLLAGRLPPRLGAFYN